MLASSPKSAEHLVAQNLQHPNPETLNPENPPKVHGDVVGLCGAASNGDLALVKEYVKAETDVNGCSHYGRTALHVAAAGGHTHVVSYLLEVIFFGGGSVVLLLVGDRVGLFLLACLR